MKLSTGPTAVASGVVLALVAATAPAAVATVQNAGAAAPATATSACEPGEPRYQLTQQSRNFRVTHVVKVKAPPKRATRFEGEIESFRSFTAGVRGTGAFSAQDVLDLAHRQYLPNQDRVARPGEGTDTEPVDLGENTFRNNSSETRRYAGLAAQRVHTGTWKLTGCDGGAATGSGTWRTFSVIELDGFALCPSTRYRTKSPEAQACRKVWS